MISTFFFDIEAEFKLQLQERQLGQAIVLVRKSKRELGQGISLYKIREQEKI
jgi:hypothetical protein